jgi:hypothetical protein
MHIPIFSNYFQQLFMALNGGPVFKFSPAISLFVNCDSQEEVDELWKRLTEGGEEEQCGWLKVLKLSKAQQKSLKEQTGVAASLNEEDTKKHLDEVLQELKKLHKQK